MMFPTVKQFRVALREFNVRKGYDIKFIKNESNRITAKCKFECGWRIYASFMQGEKTFQIKSLVGPHTCGRRYKNSQVNSRYISQKYLEALTDDPTWKVNKMKNTIHRDLNVEVSKHQLYKAKQLAREAIEGDQLVQHKRLKDYAEIVQQYNPGSVLVIKTEDRPVVDVGPGIELPPPVFQRIYVRFGGQKEGFLRGCRPIIGLDGCFLKHFYGGQLLSAVGRDENDNFYPIAMVVVENEKSDSLTWFFRQLTYDIGTVKEKGWVFISNRQKRLEHAFEVVMPAAEHRNCLQHIYDNFKKTFKGQELKELLWKAVSTVNLREHELWMKKIAVVDINAHNWLAAISPHLWTRSHFSYRSKCDMLVNNICESFNAYILEAREKPIISMIESIRRSLINRIQVKRSGMEKYNGVICPKNLAKLERIKDNARNYFAHWAGNMKFEVDNFDKTYVVDLGAKTCGCKMWELSRIPYKHVIAAINFNREEPADYVKKCYRKDLYLANYSYMINPVLGMHDWVQTGMPLLTPIKRGQAGRPKKMRRRGPDEPRVALQTTRRGKSIQCKRCLQKGHNQRSCKNSKHPKSKLVEKENSHTVACSSSQPIISSREVDKDNNLIC